MEPALYLLLPMRPTPESTQLLPAIAQRNAWPAIEWLPIQMGVSLPVARFCVRDLLALAAGQLIETAWSSGEDLPLAIEDVQLAWVEMEVSGPGDGDSHNPAAMKIGAA